MPFKDQVRPGRVDPGAKHRHDRQPGRAVRYSRWHRGDQPDRFTVGPTKRVVVDVSGGPQAGEPYVGMDREARAMLRREQPA